jgi:hypothetical protein
MDNNTPSFLMQAMAIRAAAGLYTRVHPDDADAFVAAGGGVLSMYAKDTEQRDRYRAKLTEMGFRYVTEREGRN